MACPQGYYCDQSEGSFPKLCPKGTFGAAPGLTSADGCTQCTAGRTCDIPGLSAEYGDCDAGFICTGGAWTSRPDGDVDSTEEDIGSRCDPGHYCPAGDPTPTACPAGTYLASPGMREASDCVDCPAGSYCGAGGSEGPTGPCAAGYYCVGAAQSDHGQDDSVAEAVTPAGSFTVAGSASAIACPPGRYSSADGLAECTPCEAGTACPDAGMASPTACGDGEYCAANSFHPRPCAIGSYQDSTTMGADANTCAACPAGDFCGARGLSATNGACSAGYICKDSSYSGTPALSLPVAENEDGNPDGHGTTVAWLASGPGDLFGLCPRGHYCESQTTAPTACADGEHQPAEGATEELFCLDCPPGSYCTGTGLPKPLGVCDAGYYCAARSQTATYDAAATGSAVTCPVGYKCPQATPDKVKCPAGSYQTAEGQDVCVECPAGSVCAEGASATTDCGENHYCPAGSGPAERTPCPTGTHTSGATTASEDSACTPVPSADWIKYPGWVSADGAAGGGSINPGYLNPIDVDA